MRYDVRANRPGPKVRSCSRSMPAASAGVSAMMARKRSVMWRRSGRPLARTAAAVHEPDAALHHHRTISPLRRGLPRCSQLTYKARMVTAIKRFAQVACVLAAAVAMLAPGVADEAFQRWLAELRLDAEKIGVSRQTFEPATRDLE